MLLPDQAVQPLSRGFDSPALALEACSSAYGTEMELLVQGRIWSLPFEHWLNIHCHERARGRATGKTDHLTIQERGPSPEYTLEPSPAHHNPSTGPP